MIKQLILVLAGFISTPLWASMPGLQGPDHIGFPVPNLNQAVAFLKT